MKGKKFFLEHQISGQIFFERKMTYNHKIIKNKNEIKKKIQKYVFCSTLGTYQNCEYSKIKICPLMKAVDR